MMKKYGVVTEEPQSKDRTKKSSVLVCPICGTRAIVEGRVKQCPKHGTRPFEVMKPKE